MIREAGIQEDCLKSCIWIFFLHLPFIVIRIIETALFAAENPESVIVFVLVYRYSQSSTWAVVQFAVSSGFLMLGRKISHFRFD